jgi:hypothetical protein
MRQIPKLEELIAKGHMKKMTGRGPKNRDIDQVRTTNVEILKQERDIDQVRTTNIEIFKQEWDIVQVRTTSIEIFELKHAC